MTRHTRPLVISLDGTWAFAYTPSLERTQPLLPDAERFSAAIHVPGYWDDQMEVFQKAPWKGEVQTNPDYRPITFPIIKPVDASLPHIAGVGWYKRHLEVPEEWEGDSVVLEVGGAVIESFVYVNGAFVHRHLGNSTPFTVDLTQHLRYGQTNALVIAVSNLDRTLISASLRGYHGFTGGIFRSVTLHIAGPGRIESLFVRHLREQKRVRWQAELKSPQGTVGRGGRLYWRVRSLVGEPIDSGSVPVRALAPRERIVVEWESASEGLDEWSVWDPQRYVAEVLWVSEGTLWDRQEQTFGLRTLAVKDRGLELNGRPVMLRGVCDHYYFAPYANAPIDVDYHRQRMRLLKQAGYNFIRCHTWVPPEEYLEAADEVGMMVQVELAGGEGVEALRRIVRLGRKHPSVVIYCFGNENLCDESAIARFEHMYDAAKELDPGCLIMPQEAMRGVEYWFVEEDATLQTIDEPFRHDPKRLERLHGCADVFGQFSWGLLSYSSLRGDWRELERRFAVYRHPILSHEVGISGCYLNLELEKRYTDRIPPTLYSGVRRLLAEAGRLHMARRYYEASAKWQNLIRKHMFETLRHCPSIAGYDHLGAFNAHWHRTGYDCGAFNEFFELKHGVSFEALQQYNGESVVLLDLGTKRTFRCGETLHAAVSVSLFGGRDLTDGQLVWELVGSDGVVGRGEVSGLSAPNGAVTRVADLVITLPQAERASKLTLKLQVAGSGYRLTNQWDLWVYPRLRAPQYEAAADDKTYAALKEYLPKLRPLNPEIAGSALRIVHELTRSELEHLKQGKDVLLLGTGPFPARGTTFQIAIAGRANQNLALLVNDHPVFHNVPHEGYCDWQFFSLVEGGRCVVFNDLDVDFDPVLEVVSSYKHMLWQAALWEARTEGGGRLFVASCRLDPQDPTAEALLYGILDYMHSDAFQPRVQLSLERVVAPLLQGPVCIEASGETDMALDPNVQRRERL